MTHQGKPLRQPLAIFWEKRRALPRYATAFCKMFAEHVSDVFPITRPGGSGEARRDKAGPLRASLDTGESEPSVQS